MALIFLYLSILCQVKSINSKFLFCFFALNFTSFLTNRFHCSAILHYFLWDNVTNEHYWQETGTDLRISQISDARMASYFLGDEINLLFCVIICGSWINLFIIPTSAEANSENNEYLSPVNHCTGGDSNRELPENKNLQHYCYSDLSLRGLWRESAIVAWLRFLSRSIKKYRVIVSAILSKSVEICVSIRPTLVICMSLLENL
jgi:hypothetical protein